MTKKGKTKQAAATRVANKEIARLTKLVENTFIKERRIRLSPVGKMAFDAGNALSSFVGAGKIFGNGAYKMQGGNTTWDTTQQVPTMHSNSDSIRFQHREYLGQVSSSLSFTTQRAVSINPGLPSSFPYLASIASAFQEYKFKGLVYEFKSTSGDALSSTNTALGTVMMVAQYRADAPPPTNKLQVMNEMWSANSKPSSNCFLPIECSPKESPLGVQYIRSSAIATTQDAKFYDLANVYICTEGSQASADVGELWATYDVELYKPVMANSTGIFADNGWAYRGLLATTSLELGVGYSHNGTDYGLACVTNGVDTITLPANLKGSRYMFSLYYVAGTSFTLGTITYSNCTAVSAWENGIASAAAGGGGTTNFNYTTIVEVTADSAATIQIGATISGSCTVDAFLTQVDDEFIGPSF